MPPAYLTWADSVSHVVLSFVVGFVGGFVVTYLVYYLILRDARRQHRGKIHEVDTGRYLRWLRRRGRG
jgi:hypothetical protein